MMRMFRRSTLLLPLLVVPGIWACFPSAATPSPVEDGAYARTPGETLRYREVAESSSSYGMGVPAPSDAPPTVRDVRLAIRFAAGGTARAWIEALRVETPEQPAQIAGADVLQLPFVLMVGPRGIDSILATPEFPRQWSGLRSEFGNFLPRLPGGPLHPGREWEDVSTIDLSDSAWVGQETRTARYRVAGDSVIDGAPVVVVEYSIEIDGDQRSRSSGRYDPGMPILPPYVISTYQEEEGRFYFAPGTGRLVRRTRSGVWEQARTSYQTEAAVQVTEYSSTLELLSAGRR